MKYSASVLALCCLFSFIYTMEKCEANEHLEKSNQLCTNLGLLDTAQTAEQRTLIETAMAFVVCVKCKKSTSLWIPFYLLFGEGIRCITTCKELEKKMLCPEWNLKKSKLSSIPPEIQTLPHLTKLSLASNKLKKLPEEMVHLTQLQELNISNNPLYTIPKCVFKLPQLTHFNADNIGLEDLPDEISTLTSLQKLSVSNNYLSALPHMMTKLTNLQCLDCSDNEIALSITSIVAMTQLTKINIEANPIAVMVATYLTNTLGFPTGQMPGPKS